MSGENLRLPSSPFQAVSLKAYRIIVFCLLWTGYACTYLVRKPLGVIKADLAEDLKLTKVDLGMLDSAFLLPYAVMQVFLSSLADSLGPRKTIAICFTLAGTSMAFFGIMDSFYLCVLLLFLCGSALAPCWPSSSKGLALWFMEPSTRDKVFGLFSTCALIGGIFGTALAVWFQKVFGWRMVHLLPSTILLLLALIVFAVYRSPQEKNGIQPSSDPCPSSASDVADDEDPDPTVKIEVITPLNSTPIINPDSPAIGSIKHWLSLWSIPLIPEITLAVFCLKVVRYCMYMWLPLYLLDYLKYNKTDAGMMSTAFEVGGGVGSAIIGFVTSHIFGGRSLLALFISMILSAGSLLLFIVTAQWGPAANIVCLLLAGATNCGPDSLLSGSIPARLGEKNGLGAGAALTGVVNGAGSLGTVLQGPIIGWIAQYWGWVGVFLLMVLLSGVGAAAMLRALMYQRGKERQGIDIEI